MDLALCTGYNLCASRQASLRGLFFTKKSVLNMRIRHFLNFNKKCQNLIIHVDLAFCTGYNNINNNWLAFYAYAKQANRAQGEGDPSHPPKPQNLYVSEFFRGLGPGYPLFELGRPVASGMQSSFPILVDFGPETSHPHVFGHDYYNGLPSSLRGILTYMALRP